MGSVKLGRLVRAVGFILVISLAFGVGDSAVSWASTPPVRSIRAIKKGSPSILSLVDLAVDPTTDTVYASDGSSISVINGATDKVIRTVHMLIGGFGFAVDPTADTVYASDGSSISVINGATDKVIRTVHVSSNNSIAVDPSTDTLYAGSSDGKSISVINGATDKVVRTVHLHAPMIAIAVDPTTDRVYVGMYEDSYATYFGEADANTLSVINGATDKVIRTVDLNYSVSEFAVDSATDTLFALDDGSSISAINGATDKVIRTVHVSSATIAVDSATDRVYVGSNNGKSIYAINGATDKVIRTVHVDSGGIGFAVDPSTDTLYETDGDSVSVIAFGTNNHGGVFHDSLWLAIVVLIGGSGAAVLVERKRHHTAVRP